MSEQEATRILSIMPASGIVFHPQNDVSERVLAWAVIEEITSGKTWVEPLILATPANRLVRASLVYPHRGFVEPGSPDA